MERRKFTREFKLEEMRLIRERGVSLSYGQASQDLGVHVPQLRDWVKKVRDDPQQAFPGHGQTKPEEAEIARLRREATKLRAERDILKKSRPTSRKNRPEVRIHCEAPGDMAAGWLCEALAVIAEGFVRLAMINLILKRLTETNHAPTT